MRRVVAAVIVIVILGPFRSTASAANVLTNPSFTTGLEGWFVQLPSYVTWRSDLKAVQVSSNLTIPNSIALAMVQARPLGPGETVRLGGKIWTVNATPSGYGGALDICFFNASNQRIGNFCQKTAFVNGPTGGFVTIPELVITSPAGTAVAQVRVVIDDLAGNVVRFDDLYLDAGPPCAAPAITGQPTDRSIDRGQSTRLEVAATGSGLSYQWYEGARGVTTRLLPGRTTPAINVTPDQTTSYWVRVSGTCGAPVDSRAATVNVNVGAPSPVIDRFEYSNGKLRWLVRNAEVIRISNVGGAFKPSQTEVAVNPEVQTTYVLTAEGPGGVATSSPVTVPGSPSTNLVAEIGANALWIAPGDQVRLDWSTRRASSVTLNGTPVELTGSRDVQPPEGMAEYEITASAPGAPSKKDKVIVEVSRAVRPQATFTVTPLSLDRPGDVTLEWNAAVDNVRIDPVIGKTGRSGRRTVRVNATTEFTLKAVNGLRITPIVRTVTVSGEEPPPVDTPAGSPGQPGESDGTGANARFRDPAAVAADRNGNLFVVDAGNHAIRRVDARTGAVTTFAGVLGRKGTGGDGDDAAGLFDFTAFPGYFVLEEDGSMIVAERKRLRKVDRTGRIGPCQNCEVFDPGVAGSVKVNGNVYETRPSSHAVVQSFNNKRVAVFGVEGGEGFEDGAGGEARFRSPSGIGADKAGNVYVVDAGNNAIRRIDPSGAITTITGETDSVRDGGVTTSETSLEAFDFGCCGAALAVGPDGMLYVPDPGTNTIKRVDPQTGTVTTVAGSGGFNNPRGLTIDEGGRIVVADSGNHVIRTIDAKLSEQLPMLNDRFNVQVTYRNQFDDGRQGSLIGRSLYSSATAETAVFTFGDPNVTELLVRLSDARPFANAVQVYFGGVSDIEFTVKVTDTLTGRTKSYQKPKNQPLGGVDRQTFLADANLPAGGNPLDALAGLSAPESLTSTLRMLNDRYQVRMRYRNQFANPPTTGYLLGQSIASSSTTETAIFTFGGPEAAEWMVRFSDARPFADRIDFFHGGVTDIELTIEVQDTVTGLTREYAKPAFSFLGAVDRQTWKPNGAPNACTIAPASASFAVTFSGPASGCSTSNPNCSAGEAIAFSAQAFQYTVQACDTFEWDFGDGSPKSNTRQVSHAFAAAGSYTVKVKVANAAGSYTYVRTLNVGTNGTPNRVQNPGFDQNLSFWGRDNRYSQGPGTATWSATDATGAARPSMLISSTASDNPVQQFQCVTLSPGERYSYGGEFQALPNQGETYFAVIEYSQPACAGTVVAVRNETENSTSASAWQLGQYDERADPEAQSAQIVVGAGAASGVTRFDSRVDNVYLRNRP
jgi:PKD repeat protein